VLTDIVGLEEFPAISPDSEGRQVAYTAILDGRRQIFVRHATGSTPLQITTDDADHEQPRWLPDGNALIYFSPAGPGEVEGAIYKVSAFGGETKTRVISSIGGGDVGRHGRLVCFRLYDEHIQLVTASTDGLDVRVVHEFATPRHYRYPRWSPDGLSIAFQSGDGLRWDIHVVAASGGATPEPVTHEATTMRGLAWRPDGTGLVYSSSSGVSVPYLPPLGLWEVRPGVAGRRQLTPAEAWYEQPDVHPSGMLAVTRVRLRTDVWRFPLDGTPRSNVDRAERLTHQTGEVRTPTADPLSERIAFLNDGGGHSNIWVTSPTGRRGRSPAKTIRR
jgi:Tol biopolymer transport system component